MELETLINALHRKSPVILLRPLEGDLRFKEIIEITPKFDKNGEPDYTATVVDVAGNVYHVRARELELA